MPRFARQPFLWLAAFVVWFGTLWWLSSHGNRFPPALEFEYRDKFLHLGYFFGGGFIFSAFLFLLDPRFPNWRRILILAVVVVGLVGALDEWHQSFVPHRSGNDVADLVADLAGAFLGAAAFRKCHRLLA